MPASPKAPVALLRLPVAGVAGDRWNGWRGECGPMISMRPPRTECRAQPAGHACGPPLREAAARTAHKSRTTTKSFARAGCEGRSCGREPAPAQGRMSIHWSQAPRQAGMYSRRSGWGAGGSLNLPDRSGADRGPHRSGSRKAAFEKVNFTDKRKVKKQGDGAETAGARTRPCGIREHPWP